MFALCIEASHARGMGHLYRALALAAALEKHGRQVRFLTNGWEPANEVLRARSRSFDIVPLDQSGWEADIVRRHGIRIWVNDRLDTDAGHAARVHYADAKLATFDDRGSGATLADVNVVALPASDGEHLAGKQVLTGMRYLVLDAAIGRLRRRREVLRSIVVSMGGSDTYGVTRDVVRALKVRGLEATVILGPGFTHDDALAKLVDSRFTLKRNVPSLAEEFARHDLAITAGGVTPWEANAAGLPCIIIATEIWEARTGEVLAHLGGSLYAGPRECVDFSVLDAMPPIAQMSDAALAHVPCDGAELVSRVLASL